MTILLIILKRKKYLVIALTATVMLGSLSYYLTVVNIYRHSIVLYAEMNGLIFTVLSLLLSLAMAVLFGAYLTWLVFRRDISKAGAKGKSSVGLSGALLGLAASGCPGCGAPILGLVGLPLGLLTLPFKGLEIKIISLGLLLLSIKLIADNIKKSLLCSPSILKSDQPTDGRNQAT
jgi:hypothetical protein